MKKFKMGLSLCLMLLLVLAGCGNKEKSDSGSSSESEDKKVLTIGTIAGAFPPIVYLDKGELVGFDIDFAKAVAEEAGYEYEIKDFGWEALFTATQQKQVDFAIGSIGITEDRKQTYDFSNPYFESTHLILVKEDSGIESADDLKGKKIGVASGSTALTAVEKIVGKNSSDIVQYQETPFMQLVNNDVAAMVTDNVPAAEYRKNNPDQKLRVIESREYFDPEYYGLLFPKGSELKGEFDEAVKRVLKSEKYKEMYQKWLGEEPNVEAILQAAE